MQLPEATKFSPRDSTQNGNQQHSQPANVLHPQQATVATSAPLEQVQGDQTASQQNETAAADRATTTPNATSSSAQATLVADVKEKVLYYYQPEGQDDMIEVSIELGMSANVRSGANHKARAHKLQWHMSLQGQVQLYI